MNLAVVPARGGSKRIPRKNIKLFNGKPMISYAIKSALSSELFERVIVSTDDIQIKNVALSLGADVPFLRPKNISDDFASTHSVIKHAAKYIIENYPNIENICTIYPCVPFLRGSDLIGSYKEFQKNRNKYCLSISEFPNSIYRALLKNVDNYLEPFIFGNQFKRTQDMPKAYFDIGMFYWGKVNTWIHNDQLHSDSLGYQIDSWRSIDIDTEDDWKRAEILFKVLNN